MQITSIELYTVSVDLSRPIDIALGRYDSVDSTILGVEDGEGNVGWGEGTSNVLLLERLWNPLFRQWIGLLLDCWVRVLDGWRG